MFLGILALILGNFLGSAINPTFIKLGTREIPPFLFTFLRCAVASMFFFPIYLRIRTVKLGKSHVAELAKFTIFHSGNVLLFAVGIAHTTAVMSMIFYALTPIMVGLISHFILHDKLSRNQIIGAVIACIGVAFLFFQSTQKGMTNVFGTPLGNVLIFLAATSLALYYVFTKRLMKFYDTVTTSFVSYILTGILSIFLLPIEFGIERQSVLLTPFGIFCILLVGILGSAVMLYLSLYGIHKTNAFIGSIFLYLGPLFSAVTAIPLLHEKISFNLVIGCILILFGVFYASSASRVFRKASVTV